jgi:hypothetical protein
MVINLAIIEANNVVIFVWLRCKFAGNMQKVMHKGEAMSANLVRKILASFLDEKIIAFAFIN